MTNREKFSDLIMELVVLGVDMAVKDGEPVSCLDIACNECAFGSKGSCNDARRMWLNDEYLEPDTSIQNMEGRSIAELKADMDRIEAELDAIGEAMDKFSDAVDTFARQVDEVGYIFDELAYWKQKKEELK